MKRIATCLLLLSFLTLLATAASAQTRQRRVTGSTPTPAPGASNTSRVPVLGGANRQGGAQSRSETTEVANGPEEVDAGDVVRVNTTLVTLPVSVMDRDGRYIPNLRKEDFRLWEDNVEQTVAVFSSVDKPFSVVLMLDTSGSTRFRLEEIQDAAITFVDQLRRDDRVMVVSFDDQIRVLTEFTSDRSRLRDAIRSSQPGDGTKLYDAVDMVMNQRLNNVEGRKAIVLFTDGVDTTSRHASYESNVSDAEELDALVYTVQYNTYDDQNGGGSARWPNSSGDVMGDILGGIFGRGRRHGSTRGGGGGGGGGGVGSSRREYEIADRYLRDLADRTGARNYEADSTQNLSVAFANVAEELRRQYTLGYYPTAPAQAGQRRQVRVRVNQPNLAVRTRDSYIFNPVGPGAPDTASGRPVPVLQKKLVEVGERRDFGRL